MKKVSIQKFSLLGIVLIAASAVTAAVLPSIRKPNIDNPRVVDGSLTASTDNVNGLSCTPSVGAPDQACTVTAGFPSNTTGVDLGSAGGDTTVRQ